jgi:hypothetical protein
MKRNLPATGKKFAALQFRYRQVSLCWLSDETVETNGIFFFEILRGFLS